EGDRVDAEGRRNHAAVRLIGPHDLRDPEAAYRASRYAVAVDTDTLDVHNRNLVRARGDVPTLLDHPGTDIRVRAAIPDDEGSSRQDTAALVDGRCDRRCRASTVREVELLLHRELHADWSADQEGAGYDDGLGTGIDL